MFKGLKSTEVKWDNDIMKGVPELPAYIPSLSRWEFTEDTDLWKTWPSKTIQSGRKSYLHVNSLQYTPKPPPPPPQNNNNNKKLGTVIDHG